mmetsp:Transcript_11135/g.17420  ORF Transcript_11135/g.17420 Transcript_11135/m.17420 type:complete len:398 (-) Transcript_11135:152-1345(-)
MMRFLLLVLFLGVVHLEPVASVQPSVLDRLTAASTSTKVSLRPHPNTRRRSERTPLEKAAIHHEKIFNNVVASASAAVSLAREMTWTEHMIAGAVSRSVAQTMMQPFNVMKTLKQAHGTADQLKQMSFKLLTRGAGAQFLLSMPHGAIAFAVVEQTKKTLTNLVPNAGWAAGPLFDFMASTVSTTICSVVSTPQMVITDRLMAGRYPHLGAAVASIARTEGLRGFYNGWFTALAQKIPSYGLTWVLYQGAKDWHRGLVGREATDAENFGLGAFAAGATVCLMIPLDTVKTRIVTQPSASADFVPYRNMVDCFTRVFREEGLGAFYTALPPRLASVVPMIGIQFQLYEAMKRVLVPLDLPEMLDRNRRRMRETLQLRLRAERETEMLESIEGASGGAH